MREDMYEVIIERPRWGSHRRYVRRKQRIDGKITSRQDPDILPLQIGLKRAARSLRNQKWLNENLNPLRRYLEGQVNRPWNKVWSDICANLKTSSTVQQHVRDHVADFVAMEVMNKDGAPWVRVWRRFVRLSESPFELYVDPRTGILRRNKHRKTRRQARREEETAKAKELATRMRELARDTQVHRFDDGAWWEVKLSSLWTDHDWARYRMSNTPHPLDVVLGTSLTRLPPAELYNRDSVYAIAKRQLSRKEVRKLGLPR